jgi:hypothetical protein
MNPGNSTIARLGYISIVCFVISIIAIGIHKKAYQAVAPPIYDPISYYSKSQIVWNAISHHDWKSAFEQFPLRPPGTALILYPFGFVPSIQSFLFRSTLAPIMIWELALIIIILPKINTYKEALVGFVFTVGLIALPIFYHFEVPIDSQRAFGISLQWGLMDVLQGSVGALAVGFLYTGIRKSIKSMVLIAWLLGAYTFFIKPSGILVIGCLFLIYLTESFISWKSEENKRKNSLLSYFLLFLLGIAIAAGSIWLAFFWGYLSRENIKVAQAASKILITYNFPPLPIQLGLLVNPVFGYWWFIPIVITTLIAGTIAVYSLIKWRFSCLGMKFLVSLIIIATSLYWWVTMAGQEHRYLFPFIFVILSWLIVPILFDWMVSLGSRTKYMATVYCLIPLISIITLLNLHQGKVTSKIEKFFGYNLDVGQYIESVRIGKLLVNESRILQKPISIYSIGGWYTGAVEMTDWVHLIENQGREPHFIINRPNDWIHPGIKIRKLILSDYIITEKNNLGKIPNCQLDLQDWKKEEAALVQFINSYSQNPDTAIKLIENGPILIYKVENRERFISACNQWVATRKWSDDFWVRNSYANGDFEMPRLQVIESKDIDYLLSKNVPLLPIIDFGHKITLLALLRNAKNDTLEGGDQQFTFLFRADQEIPMKYAIFIHLLDRDKKVIYQHDFQIDPLGGPIPAGTYWKSLVTIPESELSKTYYIGFGPYIPNKNGTYLQSNCNQSDWNGNRVLLPLK